MLPSDFAPRNTVYYYYRKWKNNGLIEEIHENPRNIVREQSDTEKSPSIGLIGSRIVRTSRNGGEARGIDGRKKTKGKKQHIITDTLGLVLVVVIHAANIHDSKGAMEVIGNLKGRCPRLRKIIADRGYRGELIENVREAFGWILEVVLRPNTAARKFTVLPKRWIVERTFSWFESFRRLSKDYKVLPETSQTMIDANHAEEIRMKKSKQFLIIPCKSFREYFLPSTKKLITKDFSPCRWQIYDILRTLQ